mmetsp:Transcript_131731/g.340882  ORF Transcript_131731/g.340882 Transcript_131731/m.340882 type:complete len:242 (+) Transcript_131731:57-782(+)
MDLGLAGAVLGGMISGLVVDAMWRTEESLQTSNQQQQYQLLRLGLKDQGQFHQLAQSLVPSGGPPPELMSLIIDIVKKVLGRSVRLEKQVARCKRKDLIGSDFVFHIVIPHGCVTSQPQVTSHQMLDLRSALQGVGLEAKMRSTVLKIRHQDGNLEVSIDLVPRKGDYLNRGQSHNNIRCQNAARVLKYWVRVVQMIPRRSHDLEQLVVRADEERLEDDTHGLELFLRASRLEGYDRHLPM